MIFHWVNRVDHWFVQNESVTTLVLLLITVIERDEMFFLFETTVLERTVIFIGSNVVYPRLFLLLWYGPEILNALCSSLNFC